MWAMALDMPILGGPWGSQPSASRAARVIAALDEPPIQIGGPPARTGRGDMPTPTSAPGPPTVGYSSANAARIGGMAASTAAPRDGVVDAEHHELRLEVTGSGAQDRPAPAQPVEGHERLRGDQRVAVRQHVDVGEQVGPSGLRGQPAEGRDRVVPGGRHGLVGRSRHADVVADRDVERTRVVGSTSDRGQLVGARGGLPRLDVPGALRLDRQLQAPSDLPCRDDGTHRRSRFEVPEDRSDGSSG